MGRPAPKQNDKTEIMSVDRDDPCPCGSGKKYHQCCLLKPAGWAVPPGPALDPAALLQQAVRHFEAGQLPQSEACCQQVLGLVPNHPDALHVLGLIALRVGKVALAADLVGKAVQLAPKPDAQMHYHLGAVLQMLQRREEARGYLQRATQLQADFAPAYFQLGTVLLELGQYVEAADAYRRVLALQPDHADTLINLAMVLQHQGALTESEACSRAALRLQPASLHAWCNLGVVLMLQARAADAAEALQEALRHHPDQPVILANLGTALESLGRLGEAEASCRRAVEINPALAIAHNNLGEVLLAAGRAGEAVACYRRALEISPDYVSAHTNLLLALQYQYGCTAADAFAEHRRFAASHESPLKSGWPVHEHERHSTRRLRVGYVSADLRRHAVAFFFEPILASHDRSRVEVFCYYNHTLADDVTARLRALSDHWLDCAGLADAALAERIRADGIDILVDLSGHTSGNRLLTFARKPAPVQLTWMGFPGTTGLDAVDYRLTDTALDPANEAGAYHSEKLLYLPASCVFQPAAECPPVNRLPALEAGHVTLACLNNLAKINAEMIAVWGRIMAALPGSRIMLGNAGDPGVQQWIHHCFAAAGVSSERVLLLPTMTLGEYLMLHHRIDLALDSFPYGGGTTTYHSLSMGVPVVTLAAHSTPSRQGAAILNAVGLPEFITRSEHDYVQCAIGLANDLPKLDAIRQSLRPRLQAVAGVGAQGLTRALEQAYAEVWRTWCEAP
jgi:predicted O-linked N-acetylglucosamine transferase (SPINDLY family)